MIQANIHNIKNLLSLFALSALISAQGNPALNEETAAQLANADVETQIIVRAKMKEIIAKDEEELEEFNNLEIPSTPISNETQTPQPQN